MKNPATLFRMYFYHFLGKVMKAFCIICPITLYFFICPVAVKAQDININTGGYMIMNGTVSLMLNNAGFNNNGSFNAGNGTVKFIGNIDTTVGYVKGTSCTTFYNLAVEKDNFGVTLKSSVGVRNVLTIVAGKLYTDSNLTLLSNDTLTARVDVVPLESDIIGKAMVERYIPSKRAWRLMTAPVTQATSIFNSWQNSGLYLAAKGTFVSGPGPTGAIGNGLDVSPKNNVSMKKWDSNTQQYVNVLNSKVPISAGTNGSADNTGYLFFVRGDRNLNNFDIPNTNITTLTSIGKLQIGTQVFPASHVEGKYTLIGNPFASPIDFNLVVLTNLIKRFYVWDPTINLLGGYVMLDDLGNTGSFFKSPIISGQTKNIQSSQAFFVETATNSTASITINESSKSTIYTGNVFRPMSPNSTLNAISSLAINLYLLNVDSSTILADGNLVQFGEGFSDSVKNEDAIKFININENLALVRRGIALTAERRPPLKSTDTLNLKLWKTTQRAYNFEFIPTQFDTPDLTAFLIDNFLNTATAISLSTTTKINFKVDANPASSYPERFKVVFKMPDFIPLPVTILGVTAILQNNNIAVHWKVEHEINLLQYEVEKSTDGTLFNSVYTTTIAANNNINIYNWLDKNIVTGNNIYRIKSIDLNGSSKYSFIVNVVVSKKTATITIFPNLVVDNNIHLQFINQLLGNYQINLINNAGQIIFNRELLVNGDAVSIKLTLDKKIPIGIYQIQIIRPDLTVQIKRIDFL